jgi:hypothetical protein
MATMRVNVGQRFGVAARRAFLGAISDVESQLPDVYKRLASAMDLNKIPRSTLKDTNVRIAQHAQDAIVGGWRSRLPRGSASYRPEDRLTGTLGDALGDSAMTANSTDRTISFINVGYLNQHARHWYRVNYGAAGPNFQGGGEGRFPVPFPGGGTLGSLGDVSPPAARSYLPRVFMWEGNEFIVLRGPGTYPGRGSRAARFSDLGLEAVAEAMGPAYAQMYDLYLTRLKLSIRKRGGR